MILEDLCRVAGPPNSGTGAFVNAGAMVAGVGSPTMVAYPLCRRVMGQWGTNLDVRASSRGCSMINVTRTLQWLAARVELMLFQSEELSKVELRKDRT